jgi:hypothetical protein
VRRWLKESRVKSGPLFRAINRHGNIARRGLNRASIGWILKRAARRAGMNGANEQDIMRRTGHESAESLAKYIRFGQMFTHNAAVSLGI